MKNRIKGCEHRDSKVIQKFAAGGRVGTKNNDPAGPRKDSSGRNASSMTGNRAAGIGGSRGGVGGIGGAPRQGTNNNDVGPRGAPRNSGLGLTTGKTWSGNTAYGKPGGMAMGFARNPTEARAKMAAAAQPKASSKPSRPAVTPAVAPKKKRMMGLNPAAEKLPSIPPKALMYPFGEANWQNNFGASPRPGARSKRNGPLGERWDDRVPPPKGSGNGSGGGGGSGW